MPEEPTGQAAETPRQARHLEVLPLLRHWLAVALVGVAAGFYYSDCRALGGFWADPAATLLYPVAIVGLTIGSFWARFFTICLSASILAINLPNLVDLEGQKEDLLGVGLFLTLIVLLSGQGLGRRFEGRPGRFNFWAAGIEKTLDRRLKCLIVAQSITLGLAYAVPTWSAGLQGLVIVLGGLTLAGLTFLRAAALLPLTGSLVAQLALLAVHTLGAAAHGPREWIYLTEAVGVLAVSLVISAPLLLAAAQTLAKDPSSTS